MPPNKPHHYSLAIPLARTFFHPADSRWWRCRPTLAGIELGFREDESGWSSRVVERAWKPTPTNDTRTIEVEREQRIITVVQRALELVSQQIADGFVEQSESAGSQLWEMLPGEWNRFGVDVSALVHAQEARGEPSPPQVASWLIEAAAAIRYSKFSRGVPVWWPPITGEVHTRAVEALRAHIGSVIEGCVLALATPGLTFDGARVFRDVLSSAAKPADDVAVFEVLCGVMLVARSAPYVSWPSLVAHLCTVSEPRVERLTAVLHSSADELFIDRAAMTLALWSADRRAYAALRDAACRRVLVEPVLAAVGVAPRRGWLEVLEHSYHRAHASLHPAIDAAIAACNAAS